MGLRPSVELLRRCFNHFGYEEEQQRNQFIEKIQEEYIDEEIGTLNRKGQKYLTKPYVKNEKFREEIINFVKR